MAVPIIDKVSLATVAFSLINKTNQNYHPTIKKLCFSNFLQANFFFARIRTTPVDTTEQNSVI